MKFLVTLREDGRQIEGDIDVPGSVPPGPYRAAAVAKLQTTMEKMLRDRRQSGAPFRQRRDNLVSVLAAQIEPMLLPASPARTEVVRDERSNQVVRHVQVPATPAPRPTAVVIAKKLALSVLGEQLLAEQAVADVHRQQEQAANISRRIAKAAEAVLDRQRSGPRTP